MPDVQPDPRRWFTLVVVVVAALIVALDNSVLIVAIPTILDDFHTTLPSLQWVVTGYGLTFAALLITGGRLGDVYGHRRVFVVGTVLFGCGSLLAALSWNVPSLVLGEAFIEGVGASLMLPNTQAIIHMTFHGRERGVAFGWWGATIGAALALGPVVGGFLTTNYSWRWSFGINVIVAPLAAAGVLIFVRKDRPSDRSRRLDVPGAILIASGMVLLVFGLTQAGRYGWAHAAQDVTVAGLAVWPARLGISVVPLVFVASAVLLTAFYKLERIKERRRQEPLFEFGQLRHRTFRYGLLTAFVLFMGQFALIFTLPVLLQEGRHLSAERNGLWILPIGVFVIVGAQIGGQLTRRVGPTLVARLGLVCEAAGLFYIALTVSTRLSFLQLLPGFTFVGLGIGAAASQLTNVILSEIPNAESGMAGGANTTVRQLGNALGVAVLEALLTGLTIRYAVTRVTATPVAAGVKSRALADIHANGVNFVVPSGATPRDAAVLGHTMFGSLVDAARPALLVAALFVAFGAILSWRIPRHEFAENLPGPEEEELAAASLGG